MLLRAQFKQDIQKNMGVGKASILCELFCAWRLQMTFIILKLSIDNFKHMYGSSGTQKLVYRFSDNFLTV